MTFPRHLPDTVSDTAKQLSMLDRLFADDSSQQQKAEAPALVGEDALQAGPLEDETLEGAADVDPAEVDRLDQMLRQYACEVYRLPGDGVGIDAPRRWMMANWSRFGEICQLFWSPVGDAWLDEHWTELRLRQPRGVQMQRWRHE